MLETCNAGTFPNNITQVCDKCPYAKYTPFAMDKCLTCPAGFATDVEIQASSCTACDSGKFNNGSKISCSICPEGTYSLTRASGCVLCDSGKYANGTQNSQCSGKICTQMMLE